MPFSSRRSAQVELARLLKGRPDFSVIMSKSQVASALWDYGEDNLAARALTMSDEDLASIQRIAAWFEDRKYPLPMSGQRITHNHVAAFAAVTYFEGEVRPLAQIRRRASRAKPPRYAPLPPDPGAS